MLSANYLPDRRNETSYGIEATDTSVSGLPLRFENLIRTVHDRTGRKVVILVDEYDKPLLDLTEDHPLFEKNQKMLKSFYSIFWSMDEYIRFTFITGSVSAKYPYSATSIISMTYRLKRLMRKYAA